MTPEEKQAATHFIESLWANDPWMYGNTCASLQSQEIDWDAPAELTKHTDDGKYYTVVVSTHDGRRFSMSYREGGWAMGYQCNNCKHFANKGNGCPCYCHRSEK